MPISSTTSDLPCNWFHLLHNVKTNLLTPNSINSVLWIKRLIDWNNVSHYCFSCTSLWVYFTKRIHLHCWRGAGKFSLKPFIVPCLLGHETWKKTFSVKGLPHLITSYGKPRDGTLHYNQNTTYFLLNSYCSLKRWR